MGNKSKETIYRSVDGQRWRITSSPKYDNRPMMVRVKDGWIRWSIDGITNLVEESIWLKNKKKNKVKGYL